MQYARRFALFACFLCLCLIAAPAAAADNDQKEVDRLQKQVNELNQKLKQQKKASRNLESQVTEQQTQIKTLKQHMTHVYKQTIKDAGLIEKYRLGNEAYLRSSYFDLNREDNDANQEGYDNAFVNYFDLKFSADPSEEVRFHATLTMYKLWGTWNAPEDVRAADFHYSNKPSDSAVKVKRAYVDYRPSWLDQKINLTFGRMPTSGGYLTKYRYNRPAMTTYPDLTFNAESDGAALTFYFNQSIAKSLNLIYARSEDDIDANPFLKDPKGLEDIDFYTIQLNNRLPFLDNSLCILQWFRVDNLRPTGDDAFRDLIRLNDIAATLQFPDELGYVDKYTLQVSNDRLFDWPLDVFASAAYSKTKPNGEKILVNGLPLNSEELPTELNAALSRIQQEIYGNAGPYLGSADNEDSEDAWAFYAGLRYHLPFEKLRNPKIGLEYFDGSKHWVGLNIAAVDPYQKLNTRGSVWEIYWNQPLVEKTLQMRTGYQFISRDYSESLLSGLYGEPKNIDRDDRLLYISMEYVF